MRFMHVIECSCSVGMPFGKENLTNNESHTCKNRNSYISHVSLCMR